MYACRLNHYANKFMSSPDHPLIGLMRAAGHVEGQLGRALVAHGLGLTEYLVLLHLRHSPSGNLRRIDLAGKVGLTASGVTRVLNPMEKIGLVSKEVSARDARASLVALTAAGKRTFEEASNSFAAASENILGRFDDKDRTALKTVISRLT